MKKEPGMAYNTKTLNKVFAGLSIVFLITVIWTFMDDYIRPWKFVQIKGLDIAKEVTAAKLKEMEGKIDSAEVLSIKEKIKTAEADVQSRSAKVEAIETKLSLIQKKIYSQNMINGNNGAFAGEWQFKYEHAVKFNHMKQAKKYKAQLDKFRAFFAEGKDTLKTLTNSEKAANKSIAKIKSEVTSLEKELNNLVGVKNRTIATLDKTEKTPLWALRNAPFIDYLDPTIKIQQVVVTKALDDRYFQQIPRVDRCTTCHLFIGKTGFETQENPYKTHPKLESLAVGINSPHPFKEFGCTSCHQGEGHKVNDFNSPIHMPNDKAQEKVWKTKYGWHAPHKKPNPMVPLKYTESQCLKCHTSVERVPQAAKLNEGRDLIEQYGCYACHKIEGWQHLKKPGPMLAKVGSKIKSKEFIKNWIWSPHAFNPLSKMPAFFNQDNNKSPEHQKKNITEVNAMADYLWEKSADYKPFMKYRGGNADNGKVLIETVGCVACHQVKGIDSKYNDKVASRKGPLLDGIGSKVDKDWLVSWLKKPSHYSEETVMPSFRLSDKEANDIAAFLLTQKNKSFEALRFEKMDKTLRDDLLIEYFAAFIPEKLANEKLAKMTDHERTMELGYRSIGKYGCYSCHTIEGFKPGRAPIGPELTFEGSKPIHQFGYGIQTGLDHTRHDWIEKHLKNPRRWDVGLPKSFKDLNRMPNFYLSDKEIEAITLALLGQVSDPIPMEGKRLLYPNDSLAEIGKKISNKYNCQGCHKIDGEGGDLVVTFEDPSEGAPFLVKEGHRVQSDWLYNFLGNVHEIRPWVKLRMPSFNLSAKEKNALVAYFQADANQPTFEAGNYTWKWEPGEKAAAKRIFDELACTSCHTGGFNKDEAQGPDLHNVKKRLRFSWVEKWLTDPQAILDYTAMPSFWDGGKEVAVEGVLGDDPKRQIKALTKYLMELGYDKYPVPFKKD
jgi:mono/diheme cytochrome c family protein